MDIFFQDPTEVPLPPAEVRIRELKAQPWPDGKRVHVYFEVDPFQKRPNAEIVILNAQDHEAARVNVIETMDRKMEFTMHLRGKTEQGTYKVAAVLFYNEDEEPQEERDEKELQPQVPRVVDRAMTSFELPAG